jgi:hypothetical protein
VAGVQRLRTPPHRTIEVPATQTRLDKEKKARWAPEGTQPARVLQRKRLYFSEVYFLRYPKIVSPFPFLSQKTFVVWLGTDSKGGRGETT